MGVVPGPVTVNVAGLIVVGSIASLKVTAIFLFVATPVIPHVGARDVTVGKTAAAAVVKPHTKLLARAVPVADFAPVVTVIVMKVFVGSGPVGVNCAVLVAAV